MCLFIRKTHTFAIKLLANSFLPSWKGIVTVTLGNAKRVFYNDMSSEEADKWIAILKHESLGIYQSKCMYPAWRDIPCTYVKATEDTSGITLELVDMWLAKARELEPSAFDVVEKCDGGHCMMLSQPGWLAGVFERAARGK